MTVHVKSQGAARTIECSKCQATLEYAPEDVIVESTGASFYTKRKYIKCPNKGCKNHTRVG